MPTDLAQWRRFVSRLPETHPVSDAIVASWRRSAWNAVDPEPAQLVLRQLTEAELRQRQSAHSRLMQAAERVLPALLGTLSGETLVAYVTDPEGIVLLSSGNETVRASFGLAPGFDWSEKTMGTNGAGTCLVTQRPVAVVGAEHYVANFHNCTCTAAPIFAPGGILAGALDVSSSVEEAQPRRLERVVAAAREIEALLPAHDAWPRIPQPSPSGGC